MSKQIQKQYSNFYSSLTVEQLEYNIEQLENQLFAELAFGKLANSKVSKSLEIKLNLAKNYLK